MAELKTCKQCGEIKAVTQFRAYYGGRKGTYTMCKTCERINSREKYLNSKPQLDDLEAKELQMIHDLWTQQRANGLRPPGASQGRVNVLDEITAQLKDQPAQPDDLTKWLTLELTEEPEYYQDEVYEDLKQRYRPVKSIDRTTMVPVYDETYRDVLEQILARFDAYEDSYYA